MKITWYLSQRNKEIQALYAFLLPQKIKTVLEIGTERGGTALLWAYLVDAQDGEVFTVDVNSPILVYDEYPSKRIVTIQGNSHHESTYEKVKNYLKGGKVDFLFIDGDHTYEGVKQDYEWYKKLVRPSGYIAFHDIQQSQHPEWKIEVSRFWRELKPQCFSVEFTDIDEGMGCGIGLVQLNLFQSLVF